MRVRLPKVNLPPFSGNCLEWPSFADAFKSIHTDRKLSNSQKFQYLKGVLSGPAELLIRHYLITDDNYVLAYNELERNYNDKRLIFTEQMNVFMNLQIIKSENVDKIRNILSVSRASMHVIENLGVVVSEPMFVHMVLQKLPSDTKIFCLQQFPSKEIPMWEDLEKAIEIRLSSLSLSSSTDVKAASTSKENSKFVQKPSHSGFQRKVSSFQVSKSSSTKSSVCPLCKESHTLRGCPSFLKMSVPDRRSTVEKLRYCFNCLGYNHLLKNCPSIRSCSTCNGRHHSLIHLPRLQTESNNHHSVVNHSIQMEPNLQPSSIHVSNSESFSSQSSQPMPSQSQSSMANHTINDVSSRSILLATAIVKVRAFNGQLILLRALLDQGSQATIITESAIQLLRLPKTSIRAEITGVGSLQSNPCKSMVSLVIKSCHDENFECTTDALVLNKLTNKLPSSNFNFCEWDHINHLPLADPEFSRSSHVDLLLGADVYAAILRPGLSRGKRGTPIAQNTALGWVLSGEIIQNRGPSVTVSSFHTQVDIDCLLRKFWEIEEAPTEKLLSNDDQWCENHFKSTHKRQSNGKYLVQLPLKSYNDPSAVLGASKQIALNRFHYLERRFLNDPQLHSSYSTVINEYLELGQMELESSHESEFMSTTSGGFECCYLPHHPVIKESSSTTKLRVVFDASCKTNNKRSLNDILYTGPTLHTNLMAVIMNWRFLKFVFVADIEKMYRRIDMHPKDTQYQRILWRNNVNEEVKTYRLNTVTFGTSSAPYTAIRVMHQLAIDEENNYPLASNAIKTQMYVDDIMSGSHTITSALELQHQLINCLQSGGFELRKWASNSPDLLKRIPPEHREGKIDFLLNMDESIKTLGLFWNPITDQFSYKINFPLELQTYTKRIVLAIIARLFDPLGWLNPLLVTAKIFLKKLWCEGLDWDDHLPSKLSSNWQAFLSQLQCISKISIPRWVEADNHVQSYEIHTFCDGSNDAYSAASYIRIQSSLGNVNVHLLVAKCKVTPKQRLTIPRIELCGAVLAVNLHQFVISSLQLSSSKIVSHFWTDSTIVLSWIRGDPERWKTFVSNRIHTILKSTSPTQWHHVPTADNPADASSRGLSTDQLCHHILWWQGPQWLKQDSSEWPLSSNPSKSIGDEVQAEMKKNVNHLQVNIVISKTDCITHRYSSFNTLRKVTAWCLRFINNARKKSTVERNMSTYLSGEELQSSVIILHRIVQSHEFAKEIIALNHESNLTSKSSLIGLNPFLDQDGVLRVGGRLKNSLLPFAEKHPVVLPSVHHFTNLVIDHSHVQCLHGGVQLTLSQTRKIYWIIHGKRRVSLQLRKCLVCFINNPTPSSQLMGDLPHARVRPSRPFSATGVDYAGPINFRVSKGRGNKSYKGYIAVFVCLSTKAIHLEAVSDLTTAAFLAALQRFFARRGLAHDMYSDCGTTFVGANNQMQHNQDTIKSLFEKDIIPNLVTQNVNWHFIPPFSPHFGGLWEAGVKSTKHHLKRIIPNATLTFEELTTVLCRIESCLNSRPLCPLSDRHDDFLVLTPGHFLIGDSMLALPEPPIDNISITNRWQLIQKITTEFWNIWSKEYLSRMQLRPKWNSTKENINIGELVLIKEEKLPPNQWKMGRILELHPGADNLVRVVSIKTKDGILKRPIVKVCPLPCQQPIDQIDSPSPY